MNKPSEFEPKPEHGLPFSNQVEKDYQFGRRVDLLSPREFREQIPELMPVFQKAFASPPYYSDISEKTAREVLTNHAAKPGFGALIARSAAEQPIGAWWYDLPPFDDFANDWGESLAIMAADLLEDNNREHLVWIREVFVAPDAQGQGVASQLQAEFLGRLAETYSQGALVMARLREDNPAVQRVFANAKAIPTGIRTRTKRSAQLLHQYWYYLC